MEELYWFTRLDAINNFLFAILLISAIITGACFLIGCIYRDNIQENSKDYNKGLYLQKLSFKTSIVVLITSLIFIFIPTKQDMLLIYGVGGTLDYIQSNEQIQKLPDKVVNAIDIIIDKYTEDIIDTKTETDSLSNNK